MITLIVMLGLMMGPYLVLRALSALTHRPYDTRRAACIGIGILLLFTGVSHFFLEEAMARMLPPWVPGRIPIIYLTGVLELAVAVGFFVPAARKVTGVVAIIMLVAFLPANIYAAVHRIPVGEHVQGPIYLLIRIPVQLIILVWIYLFAIRRP